MKMTDMPSLDLSQLEVLDSRDLDDDLCFADEDDSERAGSAPPWKVLIADDEQEIHSVTRLALSGFKHEGRRLEFISAYTGRQAIEIMTREKDIAIVLMDVVMETEHAGLDAVQHIRQKIGNRMTRIVLRTGQPGQAPEREVITRYDINDYRDKTELTAQKLFTLLYTGLSLYKDLLLLEQSRRGLQHLVGAASGVFQCKVTHQLAEGVIGLAARILGAEEAADPAVVAMPGTEIDGLVSEQNRDRTAETLLAATGQFAASLSPGISMDAALPLLGEMRQLANESRWAICDRRFYAEFPGAAGESFCLYLQAPRALSVLEPKLVDMFCRNVTSALQSAQLHQQVNSTQRELIVMLSEAIEKRSRETGNHVRRVGEYSKLLGRLWGMEEEECETLLIAAPLHDAGKIAIPDAILNKPGRLTDEEMVVMRTHAMLGGQLFADHGLPMLQAASIIAGQHHERWDGAGYPLKLAGEDIHPYGRIVALADVFDALGSDRCYKKAWALDEILTLLRQESGRQFDPVLVKLMMDNLDDFLAIRDRFVDAFEETPAH